MQQLARTSPNKWGSVSSGGGADSGSVIPERALAGVPQIGRPRGGCRRGL